MSKEKIGFRLGVYELEFLLGGKNNSLLYRFQILDVLYNAESPLTCKDIEEKLEERQNGKYLIDKTSRRKLEITLGDLLDVDGVKVVERMPNPLIDLDDQKIPERDKWIRPFKYKLVSDFNLSTSKYSQKDLIVFEEWKSILDTYDYIPFMGDLKEILHRDLEKTINPDYKKIISLPKTEYKGKTHLSEFFNAIEEDTKIDFTYTKPKINPKKIVGFMPYLLKEHNKRWYVIGKNEVGCENRIYSFDHISRATLDEKRDGFERESFDPIALFEHSIGIFMSWQKSPKKIIPKAIKKRTDPIDISFKVKDGSKFDNISYLITNKIHKSQNESEPDSEGWVTVNLKMFPEADLIRAIRRIGKHCVKDIKPLYVKKWAEEL
tara:strand:- start:122 stop:1255 length:1134 start_codon:yes stop_codon:yes gene_type:complete